MSTKNEGVSLEIYNALLQREKTIRSSLIQLEFDFNIQVEELESMDAQIESLNLLLTEARGTTGMDTMQDEIKRKKEEKERITAEVSIKQSHLTILCANVDDLSSSMAQCDEVCIEDVSKRFQKITTDLETIDARVKLLDSICQTKSKLIFNLQLEIDIKLSEHADFEIKNGDCAANKKALDKIELEITELKAQVLLKDNQFIEYSKRDEF